MIRPNLSVESWHRTHWVVLALLPLVTLWGCAAQDDARVQTLLNQRGFGARYSGDAAEQYYLGIGDNIIVQDPGHPELNSNYAVRIDGVIDVPLIGEMYVAGLTIPDVEEALTRRLREYITTAQVDVQLGQAVSKFYYIEGEIGTGGGRRSFTGSETLFGVVNQAGPTLLADEDAIRLIRSDPVNPLIFEFDYDDMLTGGWSRGNVNVRENDIVYVPPNTIGYITIFVQLLLAPVQRGLAGILQASRVVNTFDNFGQPVGRRNRFGGGGFGFGGTYGDEFVPAQDSRGLAAWTLEVLKEGQQWPTGKP